MTPNENNPDNPSSPDLLKITLRGGKENDKTINLEITDEMTSEEALQKLKKELEAFKFGKDEFNLIEIPYHPKLIGSIKTLKESLPEGTALELLMDGDVSKIIEEIGKDSLGKALEDFEQADTITFRSKEDKEEYIKAISNFTNIKIDDSKYQVKPNEYFAKFAKPMNDPNNSGEKPKTPQTPQNKQSNNAKRERRRSL